MTKKRVIIDDPIIDENMRTYDEFIKNQKNKRIDKVVGDI